MGFSGGLMGFIGDFYVFSMVLSVAPLPSPFFRSRTPRGDESEGEEEDEDAWQPAWMSTSVYHR